MASTSTARIYPLLHRLSGGLSLYRTMSASTQELVKTRLDADGLFFVSINRPDRRNCVSHATARQLVTAFERFEADESAKIAILYGEGGNFCAGYDLTEVSESSRDKIDPEFLQKHRFLGPTNMIPSKPVLAAVEGFAVAGGLELSLLADMRIAAKSAQFGVFCRRFGVPLIDGGTVRLPRIVGLGRAMEMVLTGRAVGADEALSWGLVNRVVPDGEALSATTELARALLKFPYDCMVKDRASALYALFDSSSAKDALDNEFSEGCAVLAEAARGASRFVDKSYKNKL